MNAGLILISSDFYFRWLKMTLLNYQKKATSQFALSFALVRGEHEILSKQNEFLLGWAKTLLLERFCSEFFLLFKDGLYIQ